VNLDALNEELAAAEADAAALAVNKLATFQPYGWQGKLIEMGATKRERMACAANRVGKTEVGAHEVAIHATGKYPADWQGRRFSGPIIAWVAGDTSLSTRDVPQLKLMGPPGAHGTGAIPKADILGTKPSRNVPDGLDYVMVRHVSGDISYIYFKSFDQGRERWQGTAIHVLWCDEEPPPDIYAEGLTRIATTKGIALLTLTPLKGRTELVDRFLMSDDPDRGVVHATIDDALHISPEERERIVRGYRPFERAARARGEPLLGEGRVFTTPEEIIACDPFTVPTMWKRIGGMDFGIGHPAGFVELAHDTSTDIAYLTKAFRIADQTPFVHCEVLKGWKTPVWAWPHDGAARDKGSGEALASIYARHGLTIRPERSQFEDGSISFEAGITEMEMRFESGRLRVFRQHSDWFEEYRHLHRTKGEVVKVRDDLLSATRTALMSLRYAKLPTPSTRPNLPTHGGTFGAGGYDPLGEFRSRPEGGGYNPLS